MPCSVAFIDTLLAQVSNYADDSQPDCLPAEVTSNEVWTGCVHSCTRMRRQNGQGLASGGLATPDASRCVLYHQTYGGVSS
jgi:hypothetical protein